MRRGQLIGSAIFFPTIFGMLISMAGAFATSRVEFVIAIQFLALAFLSGFIPLMIAPLIGRRLGKAKDTREYRRYLEERLASWSRPPKAEDGPKTDGTQTDGDDADSAQERFKF